LTSPDRVNQASFSWVDGSSLMAVPSQVNARF
jgi:hypothetical protein